MRVLPFAAVPALMIFGLEVAAAASFPCAKAATAVEKTICSDASLSELDEHLGRYYSAARAALGEAAPCLVKDQKQWLQTRNACADAKCLARVYLARLGELDALQPGATAIRNIELPPVDTLMWIIPPAEDTVAAPPNPQAPRLRVRGEIVDDIANGDGFVIQDSAGCKYALLTLMFMNKSSSVALETLTGTPDVVYEARGRAETSSDGSKHFSPAACTFIYRLAKMRRINPDSRTGS